MKTTPASFNPATPGALGGTTPGAGSFTTLASSGGFACNGKAVQASVTAGALAPAGGVGAAAGAWDTAAGRDAAIAMINQMRSALIANGIMV